VNCGNTPRGWKGVPLYAPFGRGKGDVLGVGVVVAPVGTGEVWRSAVEGSPGVEVPTGEAYRLSVFERPARVIARGFARGLPRQRQHPNWPVRHSGLLASTFCLGGGVACVPCRPGIGPRVVGYARRNPALSAAGRLPERLLNGGLVG
jgi:hypothetical protein